jgi:hypothetical protein
MPIARFQMPDGRIARFEVPEGTTPEQVQSMIAAQVQNQPSATASESPSNPTAGNSFLDNALAGVGGAFADLGLRGRQVYSSLADAVDGGNRSSQVQKDIAEKRRLDAPLLKTGGGTLGNIVGKGIPALAAGLVPGGQGLAGSILAGAGTAALDPTLSDESTLRNAGIGALGGAAGYGLAKGAGALLDRAAARGAAQQELASVRDGVAAAAREKGYVIPPVQTNPTIGNRITEGLAGKINTAQAASIKNQSITNRTVANSLGLDPTKPITKDALNGLRQQAGQAYEAVANIGDITPGEAYRKALDKIVEPYVKAAQSFPNAKMNPIVQEINTLRTPSFDSASAVAKIRELRAGADKAYAGGDKELGKALKSGAQALEDAIDAKLQTIPNAQDLLNGFRNARQLIAKTYTVENALNESTGNVAARKLAQQLGRGKPLSGDLKSVAQFAQAFPKAADEVASSMPGVSPLDFYASGGLSALTGNPAAMAAIAVRPGARATILSRPYQKAFGQQSYDPSFLLRMLGSDAGQEGLRLGGIVSGQQMNR